MMEIERTVAQARRNCVLCSARRMLRESEPERGMVQNVLGEMHTQYTARYNRLRKEDAPVELIRDAQDKKALALDLLHRCRGCRKDVDLVNRALSGVRF